MYFKENNIWKEKYLGSLSRVGQGDALQGTEFDVLKKLSVDVIWKMLLFIEIRYFREYRNW